MKKQKPGYYSGFLFRAIFFSVLLSMDRAVCRDFNADSAKQKIIFWCHFLCLKLALF